MFLVVEFTDGNEIAMIPDNWLDGNKCALWPPFKRTDRIHKAVRAKEVPTDSWRAYPIRELYRNENYDKVRKKVKVAEDESDLQTVDSGEDDDADLARRSKRRRKLPDAYSPDTSDDEVVNRPIHKSTKTVTASRPPLPVPPPVLQTQQSSLFVQPPISAMPFCSPPRQQLIRASTEARPCIISPPRGESTPTHSTSVNRARDIRMFTSVEQLREEVAQQRPILDAILRAVNRLGLQEDLDQGLPEGISFPLATLEDVDSLEHELTDATTFKIVINYLAPIGGKDETDAVRRVLKNILSNTLAQQYSWFGRKKKLPFHTLKLASVLLKVVKKTFKGVTNHRVETATREWLRTASDREGGRKKRNVENNSSVASGLDSSVASGMNSSVASDSE